MSVRWERSIDSAETDEIEPTLYVDGDGRAYLVTDDAVRVIDVADGPIRTLDLETIPRRPIAVDNDTLYVKTQAYQKEPVTAYNIETGLGQWHTESGHNGSGLAVTDGVVCAVTDGTPFSFDAETGEVLWEFTPDSDAIFGLTPNETVTYPPVAPAAGNFVVSMQGPGTRPSDNEIWAIDARSGEPQWKVTLSDWVPGSTVATSNAVYARILEEDGDEGGVICVDTDTGQELFQTNVAYYDSRFGPIRVDEPTRSLLISSGSWTYRISTDDGELSWQDDELLSPTQVGTRVYSGSDQIHVYDAETGSRYRHEDIEHPFFEIPDTMAYTNGTLVVAAETVSGVDLAAIDLAEIPDSATPVPDISSSTTDSETSRTHSCPDCGTGLTGEVTFCPECGQDLCDAANCPSCGEELDGTETFCPSCGYEFSDDPECPSCGSELTGDEAFCPECGHELE